MKSKFTLGDYIGALIMFLQDQYSKIQQRRFNPRKLARNVMITLAVILTFSVVSNALNVNDEAKAVVEPETTTNVVFSAPARQITLKEEEKYEEVQVETFSIEVETPPVVEEKPSVYNPEIPIPKEHQDYLYEMCLERGLDYKKTLALVKHESVFNANAIGINKETRIYRYLSQEELEATIKKFGVDYYGSTQSSDYYIGLNNNGEKIYYRSRKAELTPDENERGKKATYSWYKVSSADFSYFQVNSFNHEYLSSELGTDNNPLDPYININWGTYMLSDLYDYWSEKGYTGKKLENAVLSSYNKGIDGYRKHGKAVAYIEKFEEAEVYVEQLFDTQNVLNETDFVYNN